MIRLDHQGINPEQYNPLSNLHQYHKKIRKLAKNLQILKTPLCFLVQDKVVQASSNVME